MPSDGPVLGIETSCDETAAALLQPDGTVLADVVLSQTNEHAAFGGVVPEIAARSHLAHLPGVVEQAMAKARVSFGDLAAVAVTSGPGLIGGLIVGAGVARGIAIANDLPIIAINHLEAHALTVRLPGLFPGEIRFPYLLLLVSGGHCQFVAVEGVARHHRLGGTQDDAAGEAFDKVAKLLGLPSPGGQALERLAVEGDASAFSLPRPMFGRVGCDLSFSGLKTAVALVVARQPSGALPRLLAADIAASFQRAVADVLADRASNAMSYFAATYPEAERRLVLAGGVAANAYIRKILTEAVAAQNFRLTAPPRRLCTDNAVMVAWAGIERLRLGLVNGLDFRPQPRWPLETLPGDRTIAGYATRSPLTAAT